MPKPIPTEAEIDAAWEAANKIIDTLTMVREFIIPDYPIGKQNRGLCRITVDFKKHHGWRTNKTTTDEFGRWCKPKTGVYQPEPIVVVTGIPFKDSTTAGWLACNRNIGPYLQRANYDNHMLCEPPCYCKPTREDESYFVRINGGERSENVIKGDDPLLCDAWERWFDGYKQLAKKVLAYIEGSKR